MDVHHYRMMAVLCRSESAMRHTDRAAADTWSKIADEYERLAQCATQPAPAREPRAGGLSRG